MKQIKLAAPMLLGLLISGILAVPLHAQLVPELEAYMQKQIKDNGPGCAVLVVKDGKQLISQGYGLANLEHSIPFSVETVSDIGSVAKQMTCFAVNLLIERGDIDSVMTPVHHYLKYLPEHMHGIRILDLMLHTSGIREIYTIQAMQGNRLSDGIKQSDARKLVANSQDLNFEPGSEYMYCNTAYILLADLVEVVTGDSYEEWLTAHVFHPLGMKNTYVMDIQGEVFENAAESYWPHKDGFRRMFDNSTAYGQGGIYASMNDMAKWLDFITHPRDHEWCSKATIENMYSTEGHIYGNGEAATYAKGLELSPFRGIKRIGHTGSSAGYRTTLQYFPEYDLGIVIKTNGAVVDRPAVIELVIQNVVGKDVLEAEEKPQYAPSSDCSFKLLDDVDLDRFSGTYISREYSTMFEIKKEGDELKLHHGLLATASMNASSETSFCVSRSPVNSIDFKFMDGNIVGFNAQGNRVRDVYFEKID